MKRTWLALVLSASFLFFPLPTSARFLRVEIDGYPAGVWNFPPVGEPFPIDIYVWAGETGVRGVEFDLWLSNKFGALVLGIEPTLGGVNFGNQIEFDKGWLHEIRILSFDRCVDPAEEWVKILEVTAMQAAGKCEIFQILPPPEYEQQIPRATDCLGDPVLLYGDFLWEMTLWCPDATQASSWGAVKSLF